MLYTYTGLEINKLTVPSFPGPVKMSRTLHTQTSVVLVRDPDMFELKKYFLTPETAVQSKKAVTIDTTSDCFIKELFERKQDDWRIKEPPVRGKQLHKSEEEVHIGRNESWFKKTPCSECLKLRNWCPNCRKLLEYKKMRKSHLRGGKRVTSTISFQETRRNRADSPYNDLGLFLSKVLSEASNNVRQKFSEEIRNLKESQQEFNFLKEFEKEIHQEIQANLIKERHNDQLKANQNLILPLSDGLQGDDTVLLYKRLKKYKREQRSRDLQLLEQVETCSKACQTEQVDVEALTANEQAQNAVETSDDTVSSQLENKTENCKEINENCNVEPKVSENDFDDLTPKKKGKKTDLPCTVS